MFFLKVGPGDVSNGCNIKITLRVENMVIHVIKNIRIAMVIECIKWYRYGNSFKRQHSCCNYCL